MAWEVRKSPSKRHGTFESYIAAKQQKSNTQTGVSDSDKKELAIKHTHLTTPTGHPSVHSLSPSIKSSTLGSSIQSCSWADRVRGYTIPQTHDQIKSESEKNRTQSAKHVAETKGSHSKQSIASNSSSTAQDHSGQVDKAENGRENCREKPTQKKEGIGEELPSLTDGGQKHALSNIGSDSNTLSLSNAPSNNQTTPPSIPQTTPPSESDVTPPSIPQTMPPSESDVTPPSIPQAMPPSEPQITPPLVSQTTPSSNADSPATPDSESHHAATPSVDSWKDMMKQYDDERERLEQLSWADRCDSPPLSLPSEEELSETRETRSPGRLV